MSWALRISAGGRVGSGVVIAPRLLLTAEHVVRGCTEASVRLPDGRTEQFTVLSDADTGLDAALLAPCDETVELDRRWIVRPRRLFRGRWPIDQVRAELCTDDAATPHPLTLHVHRADDMATRVAVTVDQQGDGLRESDSGAPVIEGVTPRLVGILRSRDPGATGANDERSAVGALVPIDRMAEYLIAVAVLVEAPYERDADWLAHFEPRSRGVIKTSEHGDLFTGREQALAAVEDHLASGTGLCVVTGRRGAGKSSVIARAVARAGRAPGARGRLDAAVWAGGAKQTDTVAVALGEQLGCDKTGAGELPDRVAAFVERNARCTLVVDAVDEAADPPALSRLLCELADRGATVVVGALLTSLDREMQRAARIDLDVAPYRDDPAVAAAIARRLRASGRYGDDAARAASGVVAARVGWLFLAADLLARSLAERPVDVDAAGWEAELPTSLAAAFDRYLERFGDDLARVLALLEPLTHARGGALRTDGSVWLATANALRRDDLAELHAVDVRPIIRRASDYLVQASEGAVRLYHEGLADAIRERAARDAQLLPGELAGDELRRVIADRHGRFIAAAADLLPAESAAATAYDAIDPYLLSGLAGDLAAAGRAGELLDRPGYLLAADVEALRAALVMSAQDTSPSREAARIAAVSALATEDARLLDRAARLCAALRCQGDGPRADAIRAAAPGPLPYELICGPPAPPHVLTVERAHHGGVVALAVVSDSDSGRPLIISAGSDGAIRSWQLDGSSGRLDQPAAHNGAIGALAVVSDPHSGRPLIISAGDDGAIRSWQLDGSRGPLDQPAAHDGRILTLAVVRDPGRGGPLLISAGNDGAIHSWQLDGSRGPLDRPGAHRGAVSTLAVVSYSDGRRPLIISGGDSAIRSWQLDGSRGPLDQPAAHHDTVRALAVVRDPISGRPLIISGGSDGGPAVRGRRWQRPEIRSWRLDGSRGPLNQPAAHDGMILAFAVVPDPDTRRPLLISADANGAIRSWQLDGSRGSLDEPAAHHDAIRALVVVRDPTSDRPLVISAGGDGAIRSWQLDSPPASDDEAAAHQDAILALAVVSDPDSGRPLIISAGDDGLIRRWQLDGSRGPPDEPGWRMPIRALAVASDPGNGRPLIISAGDDHAIWSWQLDGKRGPLDQPAAHDSTILALAVVRDHDGGRQLLISADLEGAIRSWQLDGSRGPLDEPAAHPGSIRALAVIMDPDNGRPLLISAGGEGTIRSWQVDGSRGPLDQPAAADGMILAFAVTSDPDSGRPLLISADSEGALRSWQLDGTCGPLDRPSAHRGAILALAVVSDPDSGRPLIVSADADGAIRSWQLDGTRGSLDQPAAHRGSIGALGVASDPDSGRPLIISADSEGTMIAHAVRGSTAVTLG
jgi:WD40 repeat protein